MSAAQQHAAAILAAANNQLTPEQSRHCFLALSSLVALARDANHSAYLLMAATENNQPRDADEFQRVMREQLALVRDQLKFISRVLVNENESTLGA